MERELGEQADDAGGILSLHFLIADEHDKAWRYGRVAAVRAARIYANVESARLYERAIEAGRRAGRDTADLVRLGGARRRPAPRGSPRGSGRAYAEARRLSASSRSRPLACCTSGR
jgi:hypothetical protein